MGVGFGFKAEDLGVGWIKKIIKFFYVRDVLILLRVRIILEVFLKILVLRLYFSLVNIEFLG